MVKLPHGFMPLETFTGYYWHYPSQQLYTMKVTGALRKLKRCMNYNYHKRENFISLSGYRLSHKGQRRFVPYSVFKALEYNPDKVVTIYPQDEV